MTTSFNLFLERVQFLFAKELSLKYTSQVCNLRTICRFIDCGKGDIGVVTLGGKKKVPILLYNLPVF